MMCLPQTYCLLRCNQAHFVCDRFACTLKKDDSVELKVWVDCSAKSWMVLEKFTQNHPKFVNKYYYIKLKVLLMMVLVVQIHQKQQLQKKNFVTYYLLLQKQLQFLSFQRLIVQQQLWLQAMFANRIDSHNKQNLFFN